MGRYDPIKKECLHCKRELITTSMRQKVHAECRAEFYLNYHRKGYNLRRRNYAFHLRERKRYIFDKLCEACGYAKLTKIKRFYHSDTQEVKEHSLCPNCLALWRIGKLEALTWRRIHVDDTAAV